MVQGRACLRFGIAAILFVSVAAQAKESAFGAVPGEFVVKLKDGVRIKSSVFNVLSDRLNAQVIESLSEQSNSVLVKRPVGELSTHAIAQISASDLVDYVEPNFIYRVVGGVSSLPNDPELSRLWGLINRGQKSTGDAGEISGVSGVDTDVERAWKIETGSKAVVVASIDTGVDYGNPDLTPNVWTNEAEKNGLPGVDDDGNGFVDDIHGYDFANNDGDPMDDQGHGTHTSGTMAAQGNNGTGVVGVAWNARVMGIKFLSADGGGTLADAVKSIDYATQMGVDMTSNSWGGGGFSQALYDSIKRARDAGILFVAAAGNSGGDNDRSPEYPASYDLDNIISVAAIDNKGELAYFSCFGKTSVDIAAPGVNILSLTTNGLDSWSGTSMATPHVTGVAMLLKSANPNMTYTEIKDRLLKTARPLPSLRNRVATGGIVNAYYALTNTLPPPDANDPNNWPRYNVNVSTPHPYENKFSNTWKLNVPGAKRIAVYFSKFETELGYDKVTIKDGKGQVVAVWSGDRSDSYTPVIEGDSAEITFTTDGSQAAYGFDIAGIAYQ